MAWLDHPLPHTARAFLLQLTDLQTAAEPAQRTCRNANTIHFDWSVQVPDAKLLDRFVDRDELMAGTNPGEGMGDVEEDDDDDDDGGGPPRGPWDDSPRGC